jgi:hypothetical protein
MIRYKSSRCGGSGSYDGPCGAPDCASCHPGWNQGGWYVEREEGDEEGDFDDGDYDEDWNRPGK